MSYARISKMAAKHQPETDVRHPMYEVGDKLWVLKQAVSGDRVMTDDRTLGSLLDQMERARQAVMDHLNAHYIWD